VCVRGLQVHPALLAVCTRCLSEVEEADDERRATTRGSEERAGSRAFGTAQVAQEPSESSLAASEAASGDRPEVERPTSNKSGLFSARATRQRPGAPSSAPGHAPHSSAMPHKASNGCASLSLALSSPSSRNPISSRPAPPHQQTPSQSQNSPPASSGRASSRSSSSRPPRPMSSSESPLSSSPLPDRSSELTLRSSLYRSADWSILKEMIKYKLAEVRGPRLGRPPPRSRT